MSASAHVGSVCASGCLCFVLQVCVSVSVLGFRVRGLESACLCFLLQVCVSVSVLVSVLLIVSWC